MVEPNPTAAGYFSSSPATSVTSFTSKRPAASMGVVDYGAYNNSGVLTAYSYKASEFVSWANFTKLKIGTSKTGCIVQGTSNCMSIQQNLVDYKVQEDGVSGEYWTQDSPHVAQIGRSFTITEIDNIWNFSSKKAQMLGVIYPNLMGDCTYFDGGSNGGYVCIAGTTITTKLPFEMQFKTVTGTMTSGPYAGASYVEFGLWVYHKGQILGGQWYDEIAFNGSANGKNPYFFVEDKNYNRAGLYNDAETVLCGVASGAIVNIPKVSAQLSEAYYPLGSQTTLKAIQHAWSAGADTAEMVTNVRVYSPVPGTAIATNGTSSLIELW